MSEFESEQFISEDEKQAALESQDKSQEKVDEEIIKKPTKIFLVRHGESKHNVAEIPYFAGGSWKHDASLTEKGIESAKKVAEQLKNKGVDILITSDLKRARETAEIIAQELEYPVEIVEMEGLREVHVGELTGKTRQEVKEEGSEEAKKALEIFVSGDIHHLNFPGGDTYETASRRVKESLDKILREYGTKAKIVIVGHGNINKVMLSLMFPDDMDFVRQLDMSHEKFVEMEVEIDKNENIDFKNVKIHGEGEAKGLI